MTGLDQRSVALDVHKTYIMVGAVAPDQTVVLRPRRIALAQFAEWAKQHLHPTDQVVLEATTNAWDLYDILTTLVTRVVVADPAKTKAKIASPVKTDSRDTIEMAKLLASNSIPAIWVPPPEVRELRAIVAHRQRLVRQRTAAKREAAQQPPSPQSRATGGRSVVEQSAGLVGCAQPRTIGTPASPAGPGDHSPPVGPDPGSRGRVGPLECAPTLG